MAVTELGIVLEKHRKYQAGEEGGERADLRGADLRGADLRDANLRGANLPSTIYGCVCRMDFGGWSICVYHDRTAIGCQTHPNDQWLAWTPESPEIAAMHGDAPAWWATHGEAVRAAIRCVMVKAAAVAA